MSFDRVRQEITEHYQNKTRELISLEKQYAILMLTQDQSAIHELKGYLAGLKKALAFLGQNQNAELPLGGHF